MVACDTATVRTCHQMLMHGIHTKTLVAMLGSVQICQREIKVNPFKKPKMYIFFLFCENYGHKDACQLYYKTSFVVFLLINFVFFTVMVFRLDIFSQLTFNIQSTNFYDKFNVFFYLTLIYKIKNCQNVVPLKMPQSNPSVNLLAFFLFIIFEMNIHILMKYIQKLNMRKQVNPYDLQLPVFSNYFQIFHNIMFVGCCLCTRISSPLEANRKNILFGRVGQRSCR